MYEQISHTLLNHILDNLSSRLQRQDLRYFYTRLGANFYSIHSLFQRLYGHRQDFTEQMIKLVETMACQYIARDPELKALDIERERDYSWFLRENIVGTALYTNAYAGTLTQMAEKLPYLQELGVNLVHIMPLLRCPQGNSDGGYAVSDYRAVDERVGSIDDLRALAKNFRQRKMLLALDVVLNHTSDEHDWAQQAMNGNETYQGYYYTFNNREIPDIFEQNMPEIFPETDAGNFTWNDRMQKWVMTVFHNYQWDLNYNNPAVFIEMLDNMLYLANCGTDILRLDAVAFLWKKIGTTCQNEPEAHVILQAMKACCQITAPGVLFIAEAIVAPVEIIKYFGEDAIRSKECEIAYNATFMALLWDAMATKNAKLLNFGLESLPHKLERATWLNYARCHDDIGLGFDDNDIRRAEYEPFAHRRFLIDFYTGKFESSLARGAPFMFNPKTGDARISGRLASLLGLEKALEIDDKNEIQLSIKRILLMHSIIMAFGGIPLLYYGDEIGLMNDYSYLDDPTKNDDNRWMHRGDMDWQIAERRRIAGSPEALIFSGIQRLIAARSDSPEFADFNTRKLLTVENPHVFAFLRWDYVNTQKKTLVLANFSNLPQHLDFSLLEQHGFDRNRRIIDKYTHNEPVHYSGRLLMQAYEFYWLTEASH